MSWAWCAWPLKAWSHRGEANVAHMSLLLVEAVTPSTQSWTRRKEMMQNRHHFFWFTHMWTGPYGIIWTCLVYRQRCRLLFIWKVVGTNTWQGVPCTYTSLSLDKWAKSKIINIFHCRYHKEHPWLQEKQWKLPCIFNYCVDTPASNVTLILHSTHSVWLTGDFYKLQGGTSTEKRCCAKKMGDKRHGK